MNDHFTKIEELVGQLETKLQEVPGEATRIFEQLDSELQKLTGGYGDIVEQLEAELHTLLEESVGKVDQQVTSGYGEAWTRAGAIRESVTAAIAAAASPIREGAQSAIAAHAGAIRATVQAGTDWHEAAAARPVADQEPAD